MWDSTEESGVPTVVEEEVKQPTPLPRSNVPVPGLIIPKIVITPPAKPLPRSNVPVPGLIVPKIVITPPAKPPRKDLQADYEKQCGLLTVTGKTAEEIRELIPLPQSNIPRPPIKPPRLFLQSVDEKHDYLDKCTQMENVQRKEKATQTEKSSKKQGKGAWWRKVLDLFTMCIRGRRVHPGF